jgi:hypothetical protein
MRVAMAMNEREILRDVLVRFGCIPEFSIRFMIRRCSIQTRSRRRAAAFMSLSRKRKPPAE